MKRFKHIRNKTASLMGTHTKDVSAIRNSLDNISFRPDYMILVSPVIDLGIYAHAGSRRNLPGEDPSKELIEKNSAQNTVTTATPPSFISGASNGKAVPPMYSLLFYKALPEHNSSAGYHVFPQGGHAIALRSNPGSTRLWTTLCQERLKEMAFLPGLPAARY